MVSQRIRETHEALRAKDALTYAPSLSSRVHDALFSFWRLPRAVQRRLTRALPAIQLIVTSECARATIDWQALALCLHATEANAMEVAWAFALQSEAAIEASALLFPSECSTLTLDITHGAQLPRIAARLRDSDGEFYMAFLVLLTLLERALYDLYHDCHSSSSSSSTAAAAAVATTSALGPGPSAPPKRKKNMILRDLLQSETLARILPAGLLELLRVLFLPSGLNLRNLAWHGFVVPADVPKCFGCLLLVLVLALPLRSPPRRSEATGDATAPAPTLFDLRCVDDRFVDRDAALCRELEHLFPTTSAPDSGEDSRERTTSMDALLDAAAATATSTFVPRGRRHLVHRAFSAFAATGDELAFLFALLPVLEHAVRVAFVAANGARYGLSSAYGVAQIDAYYSTLDGFGQRDKHQVLLHARVVSDDAAVEALNPAGAMNELYSTLPPAALAVCLDLFMMAAGPNVRAKLCHGEADLSTLYRADATRVSVSTAAQLLTLAWLSLCRHCDRQQQHQSPRSARTWPPRLTRVLDAFERSYRSSFHPFHQLERALALAHAKATELAALRSKWTLVQLDPVVSTAMTAASEPMTWVAFPSATSETAGSSDDANEETHTSVGVLEKTQRIYEFAALLRDAGLFTWRSSDPSVERALADAAAPRKNSFPLLLARLHAKLCETLEQLTQHLVSVDRPHQDDDARETASAFLSFLNAPSSGEAPTPQGATHCSTEARLLALGDDDGLSVAACMLEVVASAQRAATSFSTRLCDLERLVASGRARTNHRRSLLHCVFFLPGFERVLALCLSLVAHQVAHLKSTPSQCPNARDMELLQRKLLQFITAFEGCAGDASGGAQKSQEKALLLALQFLDSKAMRVALRDHRASVAS